NGIAEYSEIYLIAHIEKLEHEEKFAKISFTRPDGSKGNLFIRFYCQLRLTTTHYVFDENLSIIFAKDLRPGETKILVSDDNNKLVSVFVDDVTIEMYDKYICFYTRAGSVIADGVLCSYYDQCPLSQTLMDLVFLPVRLLTYIISSSIAILSQFYRLFADYIRKQNRLCCTMHHNFWIAPYHDLNHGRNLAIEICQGPRPRFNIKVPQLIMHLIKMLRFQSVKSTNSRRHIQNFT
ncbi:hypothetical protein RhiirA5_439087, partial [Rhizophagus irregularis]